MNYYEHHIGDFEAATAHLSLVEDAIYSRMLRRYYLQEGPLPTDPAAVARLIRARDDVEIVKSVLHEFFRLADDGWHQKRADEDIEKFKLKKNKAKTSADVRWGNVNPPCERIANASETHNGRNALQAPDTRHQTREHAATPTPAPKRKGKTPTTPLADDFALSDRVRVWATSKGHTNLDAHFDSFVSKARAKGYTYADWDEALMCAIRDDWAKVGPANTPAAAKRRLKEL